MKGNMFPISPSIISPGLLLSKYSISLKIKERYSNGTLATTLEHMGPPRGWLNSFIKQEQQGRGLP